MIFKIHFSEIEKQNIFYDIINNHYPDLSNIDLYTDSYFNSPGDLLYKNLLIKNSNIKDQKNILSLIDRPSNGNLIIDKKKINFDDNKKNDFLRSNNFGIIYQEKNLLNDFTALENISLAGIANGKTQSESLYLSKKILKKLKLYNRSKHLPSELSGGENQRIAIGRSLINSPKIIIADEPSGNLDHKNAKEFFKLLFNLKSKNRIIIYATHNRYFSNLADCRLQLINGKLKSINARK